MFGMISWWKLLTEAKKIGLSRTTHEFETPVKREKGKSKIEGVLLVKYPTWDKS